MHSPSDVGRPDTGVSATVGTLMRRPAGYLPLAMSAGALAMIVWFVALHGVAHQTDEGSQAHLWQLLVAGQLPIIAFFALRWLPDAGRPALVVLALQAAALMGLAVSRCWLSAVSERDSDPGLVDTRIVDEMVDLVARLGSGSCSCLPTSWRSTICSSRTASVTG